MSEKPVNNCVVIHLHFSKFSYSLFSLTYISIKWFQYSGNLDDASTLSRQYHDVNMSAIKLLTDCLIFIDSRSQVLLTSAVVVMAPSRFSDFWIDIIMSIFQLSNGIVSGYGLNKKFGKNEGVKWKKKTVLIYVILRWNKNWLIVLVFLTCLKALSFNLCDCGDPFLFIIDISYIFYFLNSSNHII